MISCGNIRDLFFARALRIAALAVPILTALPLSGCYVLRQSLHHNDLVNSRREVADVLVDPLTPQKTVDRLLITRRILRFAGRQGLNVEGAYRYFIDTREPLVSYIVEAAAPDQLESKTWWFPVIGRVPYLGFYSKTERDAQATELGAQGLDVYTSGASAFSSLGWFDDPIFSSMLNRNEADLAHLFLHELTHRTFWAPGSTKFNENLAEYVGIELTKIYLAESGSKQDLETFNSKLGDRDLFQNWLDRLKAELTALYDQKSVLSRSEVMKKKSDILERYQVKPLKPDFKIVDYVKNETWNNAAVLGATLYTPDTAAFAKAHRCLGDSRHSAFLKVLRVLTDESGDPFVALSRMCDRKAG